MEEGFAKLTLARVAARAGIGRSTIYNYAADKNDLMLKFVERQVNEFERVVRAELRALPTARERLHHLVQTQLEAFAGRSPGHHTSSPAGLIDGGALPPDVFRDLMSRLSVLHGMVREVLLEGVETGEFRPFVDVDVVVEMVGAAVGAQRMHLGSGTRPLPETIVAVTTFIEAAVMSHS